MKSLLHIGLIAVCFAFTLLFAVTASAQDWLPVTQEELTSKTAEVEPDADAEAIFWVVRVDDSEAKFLALKHYVRVKIFTERGREQFSKYDIEFTKDTSIRDVEARVTKPDGTVVFLKKEDVKERDIVKTNGFKLKAKSFALPGLETGAVLEYRFKEVYYNSAANMRLVLQKSIPVRTISYYVRPFRGDLAMFYQTFNTTARFVKDKNEFQRVSMAAVPAFKEEPHMLPADQVRPWIYTYYTEMEKPNLAEYWKDVNKRFYDGSKDALKANDEVKAVTAQVINGAATDDEKLRKIFDYAKNEIKNLDYSTGTTDEDKKKARNIKNAGEVLKLKMAYASDVDILFGAMARAAGFDARVALSGSREEFFFDPNIPLVNLTLNSTNIAVKVGNDWRFFSPASRFTSYGMLSWQEEGQKALITDPKAPVWVDIPLTTSEKSREKRTGTFKLLEDGTLEGEARIEFSGHLGEFHKSINWDDSTVE